MFNRANMIETTASAFASMKTTGFKAITRGAAFVIVETAAGLKPGIIKEDLVKALMGAGLSSSTAANYASRCSTVAAFWRWTLDDTKTFVENCDEFAPAVATLWGEINEIKKTGPLAERAVTEPKPRAKAEPGDVKVPVLEPAQFASELSRRLSELDTQTLVDMQAAIVAELATRKAATRLDIAA
jgi:hypothetical protein